MRCEKDDLVLVTNHRICKKADGTSIPCDQHNGRVRVVKSLIPGTTDWVLDKPLTGCELCQSRIEVAADRTLTPIKGDLEFNTIDVPLEAV